MKVINQFFVGVVSLSTALLAQEPALQAKVKMLSPSESLKMLELPEGYSLEPVLTEPEIKEPVCCVFDGNGRMYVLEMRTYMQNADAHGEFQATSRVSMHEDTDGDGKYDKHHVFADKLLLPRMILPLEDGIVIGETNTNDLYLYKDTDGDGVSDKKTLYYQGGGRGGNMEHQPSGLIWCMDNWAYTTYNATRYKMGKEKVEIVEPTGANGGQWGLTQDNYGKPWYVNAGGEIGPLNFQFPIVYGASGGFPEQEEPGFREVWPICEMPDVQGGPGRLRDGKMLNHFTATCGQDVFRGDRLPEDIRGDLLFAEPVGRLIRRTKIEVQDGVTKIRNAHPKSEFIRSADPNFRPVNMVTAPDGTLYIVDMYRGIIQEGNWTRPGSYLRSIIDKYGFDKNIAHGRIYRLVHKDFKRGPQPKMIGAPSADLVGYLAHPNGWWRDTAQKILVLRKDASVKESLVEMAAKHQNELARCHALWVLEGMGALTPEIVLTSMKDENPKVRRNAIRVSETLFKQKASDLKPVEDALSVLAKDADQEVVMQVLLTAEHLKLPSRDHLKLQIIQENKSVGVNQTIAKLPKQDPLLFDLPKAYREQYLSGRGIYQQLCIECHGEDGKGRLAGERMMAPPLAASPRVLGDREQMIQVLLHGLNGPVDGKDYGAPMISMKTQPDQWIADVLSYVRNSMGNNAGFVSAADVAAIREKTKDQKDFLTMEELLKKTPHELADRAKWKLTASHNAEKLPLAIDANPATRYDTASLQVPGMWVQVELPEAVTLTSVRMDTKGSPKDFPVEYTLETSLDGSNWTLAQPKKAGEYFLTEINIKPTKAKFFRITCTGNKSLYFSIHDLKAFGLLE